MMTTASNRNPTFWQSLSFRNWRISTKLILTLLTLSLIPLAVGLAINTQESADTLTQQTRINLSRLAFSTAQRIEQFLVDNHNFVRLVASDPIVINFLSNPDGTDKQTLQQGLASKIKDLIAADVVTIVDPATGQASPKNVIDLAGFYNKKGIVLYHNNTAIIGQDYSGRDFVKAALNGDQFTSDILVGLTTGTPGINASVPVKDANGNIIGATAFRIQGQFVSGILTNTLSFQSKDISDEERKSVNIYLTDHYGIVVSASSANDPWLGRNLGTISDENTINSIKSVKPLGGACPDNAATCDASKRTAILPKAIPGVQPLADQLSAAFKSGESGSIRYCRTDNPDEALALNKCNGEVHVIGYAPVEDPFKRGSSLFMVSVDLPESIFSQAIDAQRLRGILIAIGIAVLSAAISLLVARTLASPIGKLARAARSVETDKPFQPSDIADIMAQYDEVGNLARVFNDMVLALRARMGELQTIYEIGNQITSTVDLQRTLSYLMNAIGSVIAFDAAEVSLFDAKRQNLELEIAINKGAEVSTGNRIYPANKNYAGYITEKRTPLLVNSVSTFTEVTPNPDRSWKDLKPQSYLGIPLKLGDRVIGTIELVSKKTDAFTNDNLRILESIAVQAAVAIDNAQQVLLREERLKAQIQELKIEIDEVKKAKQVAEITETEYFNNLRNRVKELKNRGTKRATEEAPTSTESKPAEEAAPSSQPSTETGD
jgi:HAMP domain-containing protein